MQKSIEQKQKEIEDIQRKMDEGHNDDNNIPTPPSKPKVKSAPKAETAPKEDNTAHIQSAVFSMVI